MADHYSVSGVDVVSLPARQQRRPRRPSFSEPPPEEGAAAVVASAAAAAAASPSPSSPPLSSPPPSSPPVADDAAAAGDEAPIGREEGKKEKKMRKRKSKKKHGEKEKENDNENGNEKEAAAGAEAEEAAAGAAAEAAEAAPVSPPSARSRPGASPGRRMKWVAKSKSKPKAKPESKAEAKKKGAPEAKEGEEPIGQREIKYEDLDHTADVQFHSWGATLSEAFEQVVMCMFAYMTDINTVEIDESKTLEIEATGHDMPSLLYSFMDEFLFVFSSEYIIFKDIRITEFDMENFRIKAKGYGEEFSLDKHPQGMEIKAITYSNMQIFNKDGRVDIYVIVDI